jgi:hypothetical protein
MSNTNVVVRPLTPLVHRGNLGRLILGSRAIANLTRVHLAKLARMAHTTVKLAEEGNASVPEDSLARICRAIEALGFEFPEGTRRVSLVFHGPGAKAIGVLTDDSMPGWIRHYFTEADNERARYTSTTVDATLG